jgi:hypothetical protein
MSSFDQPRVYQRYDPPEGIASDYSVNCFDMVGWAKPDCATGSPSLISHVPSRITHELRHRFAGLNNL